jgi:hypothetical protein
VVEVGWGSGGGDGSLELRAGAGLWRLGRTWGDG